MSRGGTQVLTASGVVGVSGDPVRLFGAEITSGATAGAPVLRNGTSGSASAILSPTGSPNAAKMAPDIPAEGVLFPAGLFVSVDANTTSISIMYEQVHSL